MVLQGKVIVEVAINGTKHAVVTPKRYTEHLQQCYVGLTQASQREKVVLKKNDPFPRA